MGCIEEGLRIEPGGQVGLYDFFDFTVFLRAFEICRSVIGKKTREIDRWIFFFKSLAIKGNKGYNFSIDGSLTCCV